jgi:spore germination protein KC
MRLMVLVKLVAAVFLLISLTGCWDMKTIQDTNYMTAIGFDYKDGKYIVYGQMLDFASVAKQEGGQSSQLPLIWVGKEEGVTISDAFNKLYRTSQQRVFWGHVGAYLFSKDAIKQGVGLFTDGSIRYSETRFTQWVYTTNESIESIFSVVPFFNVSPMSSILMQPADNYRQRSFIPPHRLFWVVSKIREPGFTLMIPSLSIDKEVWKKNEKQDQKLFVSGVYSLNKQYDLQWFSENQFIGERWLNRYTSRASLVVYKDGQPVQNTNIKPKAHIKVRANGEQPFFDIEIKAFATVSEIYKNIGEKELQEQISKQIKEEVESTFKLGKNRAIDVYSLEHELYRDDFKTWAKLTAYGEKPLTDYELGNVSVKTKLIHTGMLKMKEKTKQY